MRFRIQAYRNRYGFVPENDLPDIAQLPSIRATGSARIVRDRLVQGG
jgi:hypothetical protein